MTLISLPGFLTDAWTRSHKNLPLAKGGKEKEGLGGAAADSLVPYSSSVFSVSS